MRSIALSACLAVACLVPASLLAEQQVTLKSGAALVGDVAFDGDAVVVTIDGSKQRVPLADVASIAPLNFGPDRQANRLLMSALEARILGGSPRESVELLAEASRLAPEDPQIAYWYASALVDSGSGKAAERVLEAHRAAIDDAYPDRIAKLASRIKLRLLVEMLPTALVERIDELNAAAAVQPAEAPQRPAFAAFRVLDQFNDPVDQSAFTVQCNGQDERVEAFADGYFLVTFVRQRNQGDETCRLHFNKYGLKSDDVEFRASSNRVELAGQFVVHRFTDGDKRPVKLRVVDRDGKPVAGARVSLEPANQQGGAAENVVSAIVDDEGRASVSVFPGVHSLNVGAEDFNTIYEQLQVDPPAGGPDEGVERQLTMHRAIAARVRVKWVSTSLQPGAGATTSDEAVLGVNSERGQRRNQAVMWLHPLQVQDRLSLQFNLMMYGPQAMTERGGPWINRYSVDAAADEAAQRKTAQEKFDAIDLTNVGELPEEFKAIDMNRDTRGYPQGMVQSRAEFGDVVVGKFIGRDPRNGQPVETTFKAIIERPDAGAPEAP